MIVMSEVGGSNIENPRSLLKSFETDIVVSVCGEDVVGGTWNRSKASKASLSRGGGAG
jgi:hypothetical protein